MASVWNGDLDGAASNLAEADSVAAATGSSGVLWTTLRLRALQGKETETLAAVASAIEQAAAGPEILATYAHWAAAVLYNGLGRYEEAAAAARQAVSSTFEYWVSAWALPELVEAAARTGDAGTALGALERLAETTRPCDTDLALGIETRCRALVSHGTAAEDLYREGTERLRRSNLRPELARSHLVFGEWLRTEGRRTEARKELRSAHTLFVAIGMEAFAERARRELAATGEKLRTPGPPRCDLTPQEEQIARLARDGLTNTQIGTQLFLSPRTVEYHLHKVFDKLGIDSRSGLQAALRGQEPATVRS
jgi:DNA-binding CsgD family transcriptional regulator